MRFLFFCLLLLCAAIGCGTEDAAVAPDPALESSRQDLAVAIAEPDARLRRLAWVRSENGDSFTRETSWDAHRMRCVWHLNPSAASVFPSSVMVELPHDFKPYQIEGAIVKAWGTCDPQPILGAETGVMNAAADAVKNGTSGFSHEGWDFAIAVRDNESHYRCDVAFRLSAAE